MNTAARSLRRPLSLHGLLGLACAVLLASQAADLRAQDEAPEDPDSPGVALVKVRLPLTGKADHSIQATLTRTRDRLLSASRTAHDGRRPVVVIEFSPGPARTEGGQFERSLSVARFLSSRAMAGVKTVAYVPETLTGHAVLMVMACEEIVMPAGAEIGNAAIGETEEGALSGTVVAAYREMAEAMKTMPEALAVAMVDPSVEVLQVETEDGLYFITSDELDEFSLTRQVIDQQTVVPRGSLAVFSGAEGRRYGFVKFLADDLDALARALRVPASSLVEIEGFDDDWKPVIIDITGPITPGIASRVETLVGMELEAGRANWVALRIDSTGGDVEASIRLAGWLARLDDNSIRTVAYIPVEARAGAALAALACDEIVLHDDAVIGAASTPDTLDATMLDQAQVALGEIAPRARRTASLMAAMIDPSVEVLRFRQAQTGETRLMSRAEASKLPDAAQWEAGAPIEGEGGVLAFTADQAQQLGIANHVVEDFSELKAAYSLEEDPRQLTPNHALELIEALAAPELGAALVVIGFMGLYFEFRTPGIGIGAFVAAVAFLLFFWSNFLNGTAGWLEVLLFVAGVCFLLLEIFVIPGFGIFGLGGGAMIIASLVLASLTFVVPASEGDLRELVRSTTSIALASIAIMVIAFMSRRLFAATPIYKDIVLDAPSPEERALLERREALADYSHLLGVEGVATTDLRPAGKAEIGDELLDVIAEAEPIDRGSPIVVVDAHANRVIVRPAGEDLTQRR